MSLSVLTTAGKKPATGDIFVMLPSDKVHHALGLPIVEKFPPYVSPRRSRDRSKKAQPQSVTIEFQYSLPELSPLYDLEAALEEALADSGAGTLDGHEMAADAKSGRLFMYGPDADALFASIRPTLRDARFVNGGRAIIRHGPADDPDATERSLPL